jgi:hypothetical protein
VCACVRAHKLSGQLRHLCVSPSPTREPCAHAHTHTLCTCAHTGCLCWAPSCSTWRSSCQTPPTLPQHGGCRTACRQRGWQVRVLARAFACLGACMLARVAAGAAAHRPTTPRLPCCVQVCRCLMPAATCCCQRRRRLAPAAPARAAPTARRRRWSCFPPPPRAPQAAAAGAARRRRQRRCHTCPPRRQQSSQLLCWRRGAVRPGSQRC